MRPSPLGQHALLGAPHAMEGAVQVHRENTAPEVEGHVDIVLERGDPGVGHQQVDRGPVGLDASEHRVGGVERRDVGLVDAAVAAIGPHLRQRFRRGLAVGRVVDGHPCTRLRESAAYGAADAPRAAGHQSNPPCEVLLAHPCLHLARAVDGKAATSAQAPRPSRALLTPASDREARGRAMAGRPLQAASETVKPSPTCVAFHQGAVSIPSDIQRRTLAWSSSGSFAQPWRCIGAATATSAMVG